MEWMSPLCRHIVSADITYISAKRVHVDGVIVLVAGTKSSVCLLCGSNAYVCHHAVCLIFQYHHHHPTDTRL